jgi:hypothetical protein
MRVRLAIAAALAVILSIASLRLLGPTSHENPVPQGAPVQPAAPPAPRATPPPTADPSRPALVPLPVPATLGRSPLADALHDPKRTGQDDLEIVLNLFSHYRQSFKAFPAGDDNASFVNALAGNNPSRTAFLPPAHPAIDAAGRLVDRWQQPYFFHLLGRDALEIRSAGPDRQLYTDDDQLIASPGADEVRLAEETR